MISSWERLVNYTRVRKCLGVAPALPVLDIIGRFLPRCNTSSAEAAPRIFSAIDISNIYRVTTSFSIWSKCHTQLFGFCITSYSNPPAISKQIDVCCNKRAKKQILKMPVIPASNWKWGKLLHSSNNTYSWIWYLIYSNLLFNFESYIPEQLF